MTTARTGTKYEPRPPDLVLIDGDSLALVCPYHGPQDVAEYLPGRAPCGCEWLAGTGGLLYAVQNAGATCEFVKVAPAESCEN